MIYPNHCLLIPDERGQETIGHEAQTIFNALAAITPDQWREHPEVGERRTLYAPINDEHSIVIRTERGGGDHQDKAMLTSIEISQDPASTNSKRCILLEPLEIITDFDTLNGPVVIEAMKCFTLIDHKELDEIGDFDERTEGTTAFDRTHSAILAALYANGPRDEINKLEFINAWRPLSQADWVLSDSQISNIITIENKRDSGPVIPPFALIKRSSVTSHVMSIRYPSIRGKISHPKDLNPLQIMIYIRALENLGSTYTGTN